MSGEVKGPSIRIDEQAAAQIDRLLQAGYQALHDGQEAAACRRWQTAWRQITAVLEQYPTASIEAFDRAFHGSESIANWASDFEMELARAGQTDRAFHKMRIDFCRQYLDRSSDRGHLNNLNRLRAIGVSYFRLGRQPEGEVVFQSLTRQYPSYGWGWIGWADMYALYPDDPWHDLQRAAAILREALAAPGIENMRDVAERLREVLIQLGRPTEAGLVETRRP